MADSSPVDWESGMMAAMSNRLSSHRRSPSIVWNGSSLYAKRMMSRSGVLTAVKRCPRRPIVPPPAPPADPPWWIGYVRLYRGHLELLRDSLQGRRLGGQLGGHKRSKERSDQLAAHLETLQRIWTLMSGQWSPGFAVPALTCPITLATDLDHVRPHLGDYDAFWDQSNWSGKCKSRHSSKTAREVGFGG